jgi:hypothetical protein
MATEWVQGSGSLEAGGGNRTRNNSLEDCGFTTKLHPHADSNYIR